MLVLDQRPGGAGPTPGLHALIVGASIYPHLAGGGGPPAVDDLGLKQLESPALTAFRIYQWLRDNAAGLPAALHTIRLLLAPAASELEAEPEIQRAFIEGALDRADYGSLQVAVEAWRDDLATHRNSFGFFFFSGHGLGGTGDDALMLASDFGDPAALPPHDGLDGPGPHLLSRAISITDLEQGMAPPADVRRTIARRQVYFVDACRNRPDGFEPDSADVPTIWQEHRQAGVDDRELSIMLATINDRLAYVGKRGEETVFGQTLLECLRGGAAEETEVGNVLRWNVSTAGVTTHLPPLIADRARKLRVDQAFRPGRQNYLVPLVSYATAPEADVTFPVLGSTPAKNLRLNIRSLSGDEELNPLDPPPARRLPMGRYRIAVRAVQPPPPDQLQFDTLIRPPRDVVTVDL